MANSGIVGALRVLLGLDTAEFDTNIKKVKGQVGGLGNEFNAFGKSFAGSFLPVASVAGAGLALAAFAKNVFDTAGKVTDLAAQTGLTTDSIQEMQAAANLTSTSLESFTNAAFKLGVNLATGTDKVRGAVEALGLSYATLRAQSPDEQFKAIATELGKVEDVQLRNKLAVDLFGKAAKEILPAIAQGYDQIADSASKASEAQLEAVDEAGDALQRFWDGIKTGGVQALGSILVATKNFDTLNESVQRNKVSTWDWVAALQAAGVLAVKLPKLPSPGGRNLPASLPDIGMSLEDQKKAEKELDLQIKESTKAAEKFADSLRALGGADTLAGAREVRKQLEAIGGPLNVLPSQLGSMAEKLREGAQAALLMGDADLASQYTKLADTLSPIIQFQQRYNITLGDYAFEAQTAAEMTEEFWEQLYRLTGQVETIGPLLENSMDLSKMFEPLKGTITENLPKSDQWAQAWGSMKDGLSKTLSDIPQTLANAFTGGGDIMGALKSIVSQIGSTIGGSIGAMFGPLGAKIGSALGSLAGQIVPAFKKLFGIGRNDELKKFNAEIDKSRQKLIEQYGSLERIDKLGKIVGVDLAAAWKSQGEAGKKHFDQLAKDFDTAVAKMESDLKDLQSELDDTIDKAADLGYEFDQAGNFTGVNFDKAKAKAEEFGVSVDGLGPAFRQQGIDAEAKNIIDAFTLLDKAGGDVGGILVGMKDEIGHLVSKSIELGTTIPSNMKPWIQNLIDTHQLLDDNGNEITDIGKIRFADPIKTEFEKITDKISDLIDKIGELIDILADIPSKKDITITTNYQSTGDDGSGGGDAVQPFASGGLVSRPTRALIGEGGEPELIGPVSFMSEALRGALDNLGGFLLPDVGSLLAPALAGANASGGGSTSTIVNHFSFEVSTLDTDEMSRMIRKRIIPEINAQLSNVGELRGGMRDGLGI